MTNILVCGSRSFASRKHRRLVLSRLAQFFNEQDFSEVTIITGGAKGPDQFAMEFARINGFYYRTFIPDWQQFGKAAGPRRNKDMVNVSNYVIAFWDQKSNGTKSTIDFALDMNLPVLVIYENGDSDFYEPEERKIYI